MVEAALWSRAGAGWGKVTGSLSLELEECGLGGLPHQATQLRGPDLHGLPEAGDGCTWHTALGLWPEPITRAGAPGRPAAPLPLHHRQAQCVSVGLPHQGGHRGGRVLSGRVGRGEVRCLGGRGRRRGGGGGTWSSLGASRVPGTPGVSEELLCPPQNSVALASIQLPPSLFSSPPAALAPPAPPDCTLQLLVFRNGRLFRTLGNTSRPGAAGPGRRRGVATPVIFAGTSKGPGSRPLSCPCPHC